MADWSRLVRKQHRDELADGEEVQVALLFGPHASIDRPAVATTIGKMLRTRPPGRSDITAPPGKTIHPAAVQSTTTIAGTFWSGFGMLALTSRRLLVFSRADAVSRRPVELVAAYPRTAIVAAEAARSFLKRDLTLRFADDSELLLEAGMGQPFERFAKALTLT